MSLVHITCTIVNVQFEVLDFTGGCTDHNFKIGKDVQLTTSRLLRMYRSEP